MSKEQEDLYKWYLDLRDQDNRCYCGHTTDCDCSDPDLTMFKESLENGTISFEAANGWKSLKNK